MVFSDDVRAPCSKGGFRFELARIRGTHESLLTVSLTGDLSDRYNDIPSNVWARTPVLLFRKASIRKQDGFTKEPYPDAVMETSITASGLRIWCIWPGRNTRKF